MIHFVLAFNRKINFGTVVLLLDVVDDIELEDEDWSILIAMDESKRWRLRRGVGGGDVPNAPF
jgi:hypothetical protein